MPSFDTILEFLVFVVMPLGFAASLMYWNDPYAIMRWRNRLRRND